MFVRAGALERGMNPPKMSHFAEIRGRNGLFHQITPFNGQWNSPLHSPCDGWHHFGAIRPEFYAYFGSQGLATPNYHNLKSSAHPKRWDEESHKTSLAAKQMEQSWMLVPLSILQLKAVCLNPKNRNSVHICMNRSSRKWHEPTENVTFRWKFGKKWTVSPNNSLQWPMK